MRMRSNDEIYKFYIIIKSLVVVITNYGCYLLEPVIGDRVLGITYSPYVGIVDLFINIKLRTKLRFQDFV
jgi:hypothetical protein